MFCTVLPAGPKLNVTYYSCWNNVSGHGQAPMEVDTSSGERIVDEKYSSLENSSERHGNTIPARIEESRSKSDHSSF